jgi:hypothetical protein
MIPAVGHPIRFRSTGFRARHLRPDIVLPCESNTAPVQCYEPRQIRMAYDLPGGLSGAGRSITIIDAFPEPHDRRRPGRVLEDFRPGQAQAADHRPAGADPVQQQRPRPGRLGRGDQPGR